MKLIALGPSGWATQRGDDLLSGWDDAQGDDDGWQEGVFHNATDDLSDDEGEETDEGNLEGGIGLGDVDTCVSCGTELEFGWDFDYCPECGGV